MVSDHYLERLEPGVPGIRHERIEYGPVIRESPHAHAVVVLCLLKVLFSHT